MGAGDGGTPASDVNPMPIKPAMMQSEDAASNFARGWFENRPITMYHLELKWSFYVQRTPSDLGPTRERL